MTTNPRDAGLKWICLALTEEMRGAHPTHVSELAEAIHAVALDWDIPVEESIRWVHSEALKRGLPAWVEHCREYAQLRTRYCTQGDSALPPRLLE